VDQNLKELLLARIKSGFLKVKIQNKVYTLKSISSQELYDVLDYSQIFEKEALSMDLMSDAELFSFLEENKFWSKEQEEHLKKLNNELDKLKIEYFESFFYKNKKKTVKAKLDKLKETINALYSDKHQYDHLSINYYIKINKAKFIYALGLYYNNKKVFKSVDQIANSSRAKLIDELFLNAINSKLPETQYREIARTDPWRSLWSCKEATSSIFGTALCDYTEEQKQLILCSTMYDTVYKHSECPSDEVIADDDALDGWMLHQRKKNASDKNKSLIEKAIPNEKIRNSEEVMVVIGNNHDTVADLTIEQIDDFNDADGKRIKAERFRHLMQKGSIQEQYMPDSQRKMREALYEQNRAVVTGQNNS